MIYVSWRGIAFTPGGALYARILPVFETPRQIRVVKQRGRGGVSRLSGRSPTASTNFVVRSDAKARLKKLMVEVESKANLALASGC
jgi:hypothetical protein